MYHHIRCPYLCYSSAIKEETGCESVELRRVDLADFGSVVEFAAKFEQEVEWLDILVYNAGIATWEYEATKDGWEST